MAEDAPARRSWANSISGRIFIAVAAGSVLGVLGWLADLFTEPTAPPSIALAAPEAPVSAGLPFSLTASAPGVSVSDWRWHIQGEAIETSRVGHCRTRGDGSTLVCLLPSPGSVTFSAIADSGAGTGRADVAVGVELADWFIGLLFSPSHDRDADDAVWRALIAALDWPAVQLRIPSAPIMLYDPDARDVVPAFHAVPAPDADPDRLLGQRIMLSGVGQEALEVLGPALEEAGIRVAPIGPRVGLRAMERGMGELLLSGFDSREAYIAALDERELVPTDFE
jgi:hypothetical protein